MQGGSSFRKLMASLLAGKATSHSTKQCLGKTVENQSSRRDSTRGRQWMQCVDANRPTCRMT